MISPKAIASTVAILALAAASVGSEEVKTKMHISVIGDGDDQIRIELDSDEMGFNLHDLQVGENRSVIDKSGRSILVTREENGIVLNVDGETIEMPLFDGDLHGAVWVDTDHDEDINVHVIKDIEVVRSATMDGIMIMSGEPIDAATQQAIRSLLESTGHGSDVNFTSHGQLGGAGLHKVRMHKSTVETGTY